MKKVEYSQATSAPTQKVAAAGIGGSVSVVLIYIIQQIFTIEIPAEVASAITAIVSFGAGYLVKEQRIEE